MTIIIFSSNSYGEIKRCLQSIRHYYPEEQIVIVDNYSADGMNTWAAEQYGVSYVYMDEGYQPIGLVLNKVISGLELQGDFLFIDSRLVCTDTGLSALMEYFSQNNGLGAIVPQIYRKSISNMGISLEDACDIGREYIGKPFEVEWVYMDKADAILVNGRIFKEEGGFDCYYEEFGNCAEDYMLRLLANGHKTYRVSNCVMWSSYVEEDRNEEDELRRKKWGVHYMNSQGNPHIIPDIVNTREDEFSLLEIGCDCGATLFAIRNLFPNAHVYGTEINPNAARIASLVTEKTVVNDIEKYDLDLGLQFDYIVFADVLEHLHDPFNVLCFVKKLLKENGRIIISIPNIMNVDIFRQLLHGRFHYEDKGLLDKTHIHFFTLIELENMLIKAGYNIENEATIDSPISEEEEKLIDKLYELSEGTDRFMFRAYQYVIRAKV